MNIGMRIGSNIREKMANFHMMPLGKLQKS